MKRSQTVRRPWSPIGGGLPFRQLRTQFAACGLQLAVGVAVSTVSLAGLAAQVPQFPSQNRYSTHDSVPPTQGAETRWVDVKTPGDGETYLVGNALVSSVNPGGTLFSGAACFPADGLSSWSLTAPQQRQVVVIQRVGPDQDITPVPNDPGGFRQLYFHGFTGPGPLGTVNTRATHGRAISVWPEADRQSTRIAVCGETFDERLPSSNAPAGDPLSSGITSSGFIAVFDGNGLLLWTHHFFGARLNGSCAVTDLSIRRETRTVSGQPTSIDVVTYCGISSHGNPTPNGTLGVVSPFLQFQGTVCPNAAGGDADNGAQWDGFIGRLERGPSGPTSTDFHNVIGGTGQDGLFGLAEIGSITDATGRRSRFAVVGVTHDFGSSSTSTFPITVGACPSPVPNNVVGVLMTFYTTNPAGPTALFLESSVPLGDLGASRQTYAKDILIQPDYAPSPTAGSFGSIPLAVVVGSTNDPGLLTSLTITPPGGLARAPVLGPQTTLGGTLQAADGFIAAYALDLASVTPVAATFQGSFADDGIAGVGGWNEYTDAFTVVGYSAFAQFDTTVDSYVIDSNPTSLASPLRRRSTAVFLGNEDDRPALVGPTEITSISAASWTLITGLHGPAGGGIAVDERNRVNIVGATRSSDFVVTPAAAPQPAGRPKALPQGTFEGFRAMLDMLPPNVGRTDGTGDAPNSFGAFGGTTPQCALMQFGLQVGVPPPALALRRMLIDGFVNTTSSGSTLDLALTRTPPSAGQLAAFELGFPGGSTGPISLPGGAVSWVGFAPGQVLLPGSNETLIAPLPALPPGFTATVQFFVLPIGGVGGQAPGCGISAFAASPALWVTF